MERFYSAIRDGLAETDQTSIFSVASDDNLVKACQDFLREKGFSVLRPISFSDYEIKTKKELIEYFYERLRKEHQQHAAVYINEMRDMVIAKLFVKSRMQASGTNEATAIKECAEIIKTVLDNYKEFKFKYQINFAIFGNARCKWITDKAIDILNNKYKAKNEDAHNKRIDSVIEEAAKDETLGYDDLDEILARLEEENNGGKEKGN